METKDKWVIGLTIVLSVSVVFNCHQADRYDMPEEINCISNNPANPDTLTGFSDGKIIHLQYMRRNR